jgi:hypothetical protein
MRTLEESILLAVLEGDDAKAKQLIGQLLPNERQALRSAAMQVEQLCSGAPGLVQALAR